MRQHRSDGIDSNLTCSFFGSRLCCSCSKVSDTMVKNQDREKHVRALAAVARSCGVESERGDVARPKVVAMMDRIRNSTASDEDKNTAETVFIAYEATFLHQHGQKWQI